MLRCCRMRAAVVGRAWHDGVAWLRFGTGVSLERGVMPGLARLGRVRFVGLGVMCVAVGARMSFARADVVAVVR